MCSNLTIVDAPSAYSESKSGSSSQYKRPSEKRQRRLIQNRESASRLRTKKKESLKQLFKQKEILKDKNHDLFVKVNFNQISRMLQIYLIILTSQNDLRFR
jgi:hypothetical protein